MAWAASVAAMAASSSSCCCCNFLPNHSFNNRRLQLCIRASASSDEGNVSTQDQLSSDRNNSAKPAVSLSLETVNPYGLGRKSRQLFDDVWRRLRDLGQLTSSTGDEFDNVLIGGPMCDFTIPDAEFTTILVAGATSRVGRILIRKLLLRGYKVKALVRKADSETLEMLPRSVEVVVGDLGESDTLKKAVEGCNKIICCATARSSLTGDLYRVDHRGVYHLSKAFQDYNHRLAQIRSGHSSKSKLLLAKFKQPSDLEKWECRQSTHFKDNFSNYDDEMNAEFVLDENGRAVFSGFVFVRGGYVELFRRISLPSGFTLDRYEGFLLSICGDGKQYVVLLECGGEEFNSPSCLYFARFTTRLGYSRVRVTFNMFRPVKPEDPPLDPFLVHTIAIRFDPRRQRASVRSGSAENGTGKPSLQDSGSFKLVLDYIKVLPSGQETDFILVSCSASGIEAAKKEKVVKAKQAGEAALKNSGLGYTIVRPGPLQDEPGGQRALVFDQGNRITQGISCADVADVCIKALHNPTARNKSFDVCYEYTVEEGQGLYELVAHLPDKSNNYLTPALAVLEKNT